MHYRNFTYNGTLTEIDTVEAPYVLQSRTLFLWAYDGKGRVVSRHSISTSSQAGGDASYAAGYNAGALISLLWNNPYSGKTGEENTITFR
jgi:hypothetical protein